MVKAHLKRLAAPRTWKIPRKKSTWITRPLPGRSTFELGMPISVILKEVINLTKTTREVRYLIYNKQLLVNHKEIKSHKHLVGLFDVISFPSINKHYRLVLSTKGYLTCKEIDEEEANYKIIKLINKTHLKGGKLQYNFNDGTNFIVKEDKLNVGDSILFDLKNKKQKNEIKLEENTLVIFIAGAHMGHIGKVKSLSKGSRLFVNVENSTKEVKKDFIIPIGKEKPLITVNVEE